MYMSFLTNFTKLNEMENDALNSIEIAVWIIAGIAILMCISCMKNFLESIRYVFSCLYYIFCCKCFFKENEVPYSQV